MVRASVGRGDGRSGTGGEEVAKGRALRRRKKNGEGRAAYLKWEAARVVLDNISHIKVESFFFLCALSRYALGRCIFAVCIRVRMTAQGCGRGSNWKTDAVPKAETKMGRSRRVRRLS